MFLVCMVCNITSQSQYDENNLEHFLNPVTYHIQYLNEVLIDISYFLSLLITVKYFNYLPVGCKCCIEYRFIAYAVLKCMKIKIIEVVISHNACIVCVIALDIFTRMLILISIFFLSLLEILQCSTVHSHLIVGPRTTPQPTFHGRRPKTCTRIHELIHIIN